MKGEIFSVSTKTIAARPVSNAWMQALRAATDKELGSIVYNFPTVTSHRWTKYANNSPAATSGKRRARSGHSFQAVRGTCAEVHASGCQWGLALRGSDMHAQ